ncbi:molybdopterin converting factor small subunit MoeD [Gluconacetobacter sacchari DSM 12717]|uniref:Molybdopterin synthase sulfur carrier subunit n=2 Tax=Gluconacetobacter sacchari TaxID=92759 RepID=A0A7W4IFA3_9PROT|nr:MoaD/ThiS family protein [Gluconacetobacter sacchari]MBB2161719.1 MoaD/ThiS family protein [Gluconacetobacter sacchari]GBQ29489.1 molybdopterin converting factor small subunit MoeD [Gluconacetobacter sacchari DSM 12717]
MVEILYFAWLRDRLGRSRETVALPGDGGSSSVRAIMDGLRRRGAAYEAVFGEEAGPIRCAVNQEFAALDSPVRAGDELAFFPPVTGG